MRKQFYTFPGVRFEEFAENNDLTLEIYERPLNSGLDRYYVHFKNCEVSNGVCLAGVFGNGKTVFDAIEEYKLRLVGQKIVIDAGHPSRREIQCPNEWIQKVEE